MFVKTSSTFVYGRFVGPARSRYEMIPPPHPGGEDVAIEILREPSATELIGKLYSKGVAGDWTPIYPNQASSYEWYARFQRGRRPILFRMEGSDDWEVLHFRTESDESGSYMAVALKYHPARASK